MKLVPFEGEYLDLDFQIPQPGVSICRFEEGIQKRTNENSGKSTLQIPMVIVHVVDGPEDNVYKKIFFFCPIETAFGERQMLALLTYSGLLDFFLQKYNANADLDITSDKFLDYVKLKLPDRFIKITHEIRVDPQGKNRVNITRVESAGKKKGAGDGGPSTTVPGPAPAADGDSDW
jgi:hypothetical protein